MTQFSELMPDVSKPNSGRITVGIIIGLLIFICIAGLLIFFNGIALWNNYAAGFSSFVTKYGWLPALTGACLLVAGVALGGLVYENWKLKKQMKELKEQMNNIQALLSI